MSARISLTLVTLVVSLWAAGCASADCGPEIDGAVPSASLQASALWADNQAPAELLVSEREALPAQDLWLAVVPGASEQWGHHRAPPASDDPDDTLISDEFRARLDMAWLFLASGVVRFVLVSGGAVDASRPDYVEALRGRAYLIAAHGDAWSGPGALGDRILIDPLAEHSTTNLRNADKLSVDLGLNRNLIVTTMPTGNSLSVSGLRAQGFFLLGHTLDSFDLLCLNSFGYTLGGFDLFSTRDQHGNYLEGVRHCGFPVEKLRADSYGP